MTSAELNITSPWQDKSFIYLLFGTSGYFVPNSFQYNQLPICFCGKFRDVASPGDLVTDS